MPAKQGGIHLADGALAELVQSAALMALLRAITINPDVPKSRRCTSVQPGKFSPAGNGRNRGFADFYLKANRKVY
jgi:hypothetical protein